MHFSQHLIRFTLSLVAVIALAGCVVPQQSYQSPGFNYQRLQKHGLAVAGVVSADKEQPVYQYLDWSKRLQSALHETRPNLPLVGAVDVRKKLGNNYKPVLDGFQRYDTLGQAELDMLRRAGLISRYVMVARIELDQVNKVPEQVVPFRTEKGEYFGDRQRIQKSTERRVIVTGQVYDLHTGRQVWQERLQSTPRRDVEYVQYKGKSATQAIVVSAANILSTGRSEPKQPEAPSSEEALTNVFTGFAEKLPGLQ